MIMQQSYRLAKTGLSRMATLTYIMVGWLLNGVKGMMGTHPADYAKLILTAARQVSMSRNAQGLLRLSFVTDTPSPLLHLLAKASSKPSPDSRSK